MVGVMIFQPTPVELEKGNVYHRPIEHFASDGIWITVVLDRRLQNVTSVKIGGESYRLVVVESNVGL